MNHLPKLSMGVRRTSSIAGAKLGRGVAAAQLIYYGNYCGPFYGDKTGCSEAIDEVDAVCCRHDTCFEDNGYNLCKCNCDLIKNMPGAIADELAKGNTIGADAGLTIMTALSTVPCFCGYIPMPGGVPDIPIPGGAGCISPCT
jgi:hypothetical protein